MDPERFEILHDKFYYGYISEEEKMQLFDFVKDHACAPGKYDHWIIAEYLYVSHPDYGKPDKNGKVWII